MKLLRLLGVGLFAFAASGAVPATAAASTVAETPPNDDYAGAIALSKPASIQLDTSAATRGADDARAEAGCADWTPISVHNSVYYTLTAEAAGAEVVRLSTEGSSYDARIAVFSKFPGSEYGPNAVACGRTTVDLGLDPGEGTYTVVVYQPSAQAGGGNLRLTVSDTPAPTAKFTVNPTARLSADGQRVVVSGVVTCNQMCIPSIRPKVTQGRAVASGSLSDELPIDGVWKWSVPAEVTRGTFRPGRAMVELTVETMFTTGYDIETVTVPVRITR